MKRTRIAAFALASALLALPASAEWIGSEWWNVDFTDQEPGDYHQVDHPSGEGKLEYGGVEFEQGSLNGVTNVSRQVNGAWVDHQPYASGVWKADPTDESYITNGVVTNVVGGVETEWDLGNYLELSTQGNDLTWTPSNGVAKGRVNLVDACLRLVGSDSAPEIADFDPTGATHRVQTAVYLKNELDPDTGETTNSVLCVYARNTGTGKDEWMELKAKNNDLVIEDGSWHRVQVSIDYTDEDNPPVVTVNVDEKEMVPVSGAAEIVTANPTDAKAAKQVQEVCFRGTGAVDNFVGKTMVNFVPKLWFETKVFLDGNEMTEEEIASYGWTVFDQTEAGDVGGTPTSAEFLNLWSADSDLYNFEDPEWCLSRIVLHRFGENGTTETFGYHWNEADFCIDPDEGNAGTEEIELHTTDGAQDGLLNLYPLTNGATDPTNLIAEVYLKTIGLFTVSGDTYIDDVFDALRKQKFEHRTNDVELGDFDPLVFPTSFTTNGTTYVLKSIPTNANPAVNAPMVSRDGTEVYVNVDLYGVSDDVVVNAYYEEGTIDGKVVMKNPTDTNGAYTFFGAVAMIGETPYETLAEAIAAAPTDGTTTNIVLLVDVTQASTLVVAAGKDFTLDLGGFTISAPSTTSAAPLFENWGSMVLTNGSITATGVIVVNKTDASLMVEDGTYTSGNHAFRNGDKNKSVDATGSSITVNGGSITAQESCIAVKTADSTVLVTGGTLTSIDNAVISCNGTTDPAVLDGNVVTVTGGTLVGGITSSGYIACGIFAPNDDTVTFGGDAEIVVTGGCGILARAGNVSVTGGSITTTGNATGKVGDSPEAVPSAAIVFDSLSSAGGRADDSKIVVSGGTFVSAVNPVQTVLVAGDTNQRVAVAGGWFSDAVAADYVADGYRCVEDADNAPTEAATYTVKAAAVRIVGDATQTPYLSIAEAKADDPTATSFEIVLPLAAETYLIGSADELFTVQTTNEDYTANLTVGTSLESTDALVYTVTNYTEIVDPVYTTTWGVRADAYVAKIVNEDTTVDRFKTFEAAADVAVAYGDTVVMVADELAETYTLEDGETLSVMENGFLVPEVMPETDAYYIVETVDGGITTYTSTNYLLAVFYNNDGVPFSTNRVEHGTAPVTPRIPAAAIVTPGYDSYFNGWSPDATLPIDADTDYTATYVETAHVYSITYQLGGQNNAFTGAAWPEGYVETNSYTVLDPDLVLPSPVLDGYAFKGWYTNGYDVPPPVDPGVVPHGSIGDYTFEAVWNEMVEVHFLDGATEVASNRVESGVDFAAPSPDPEKVNPVAGWDYTFVGWAAAPGSTVAVEWPQSSDVEVWYHAIWTSNATPYSITLDPDGGAFDALVGWFADGDVYTNSFTVESVAFTLPEPTKTNYDFVGWVRTDLVGAQPAKPVEIAQGTHENRAYRASWTPTVYEIELVLDGGDLPDGVFNPIEYTVESQTFTLPEPYKDGFDFVGWTEDGTSTNLTVTIEQGSSGDRTFTAVWEDAAPPEVDAGEKLAEYQAAHPDAEVPPAIAFDADEKCGVSFVAPAKGWYVLMTNDMVNGTYAADVGSKVEVTDANVETPITLTESSSGTTKFFKIGWSKTEPSGE